MALKIDFLQSIYAKITEAFNNSTVLKENGKIFIPSEKDSAIALYHSDRRTFAGLAKTITKASIDAAPVLLQGIQPLFPFMMHIDGIVIKSTRRLRVRIALFPEIAGFPSDDFYEVVGPNEQLFIPIKKILRPKDSIQVNIYKWLDTDTTDADVSLYPVFKGYADEVIIDATVKACIIGDSINAGSSATRTENMYIYQFRNELRKRGVNISIPYNKSVSGMSTNQFLSYFRNSYFIPDCNIYIIALGANDSAILGNTKATYKANINEMVDMALTNNAVVWLIAPTLNENNATEVLNVQYRAAISEIVSERNNGLVFGLDAGTGAFDRTVATNYMATDTAGSRIHPSDIGNAAIFTNCIVPYLNSAAGINFTTKLKAFK